MNKEQLEALDAMIGRTLAETPTHQQNEDHIRAIEDDMLAELNDEVESFWITKDELEVILRAFHVRVHGG